MAMTLQNHTTELGLLLRRLILCRLNGSMKIFSLRDFVQPLIKYIYLTGNDQFTILWLDNWHPYGPLKT